MDAESIGRVEAALEEIRRGRIVILCDDEDRENEGDLCMAAEFATPEAIAFMAANGRGLICLALTPERVEALRLPMMVRENRSRYGTAFTVSIEARAGVTTGISAADRALTIRTAADPAAGPDDIVSPGHVFPLRAAPGGVLQRTGQTEGVVDLARLAGLTPAGVICEVMNDDGTMARRPQIERFAAKHHLRVLSIADVIAYRLRRERLMRQEMQTEIDVEIDGAWVPAQIRIYQTVSGVGGGPIVALAIGDLGLRPLPVRVHRESWATDALRIREIERLHVPVQSALHAMHAAGGGILLWFPPLADLTFADLVRLPMDKLRDADAKSEAERPPVVREIGLGSQVLRDLGADEIALLTNNPRVFAGIEAFGLRIVRFVDPTAGAERRPPPGGAANPAAASGS